MAIAPRRLITENQTLEDEGFVLVNGSRYVLRTPERYQESVSRVLNLVHR